MIVERFIILFIAIFTLYGITPVTAQDTQQSEDLFFMAEPDNSFSFNTGKLKGILRQNGKSTGLIPVTHIESNSEIAAGEGLFNHYRVFTRDKRYGYGARRWPSTAELKTDGSVEVTWPATPDRHFELQAVYRWEAPSVLDLLTSVHAKAKLEDFEVFLASYYTAPFTDSRVWSSTNPEKEPGPAFVPAEREFGEWLVFPRDKEAEKIIFDGRWKLEPHPLEWIRMPDYHQPLAIRRDPNSGLTVLFMTRRADCFGVFTPYGEEKHISNYMSLFGNDINAGETLKAHSRLVVLPNPTNEEIIQVANEFFKSRRLILSN